MKQLLERIKISCLATGIQISPEAIAEIAHGGLEPLTLHEYATTGGITLELDSGVYVNAPFDDWFAGRADVVLDVDKSGQLVVRSKDEEVSVRRWLPLPGYLDTRDALGRPVTEVAMSHADRVRLSPIVGCAYDCHFCDLPSDRYRRRPSEQLLGALQIAQADRTLPVSHGLISGGSPGRAHYGYFEQTCRDIVEQAALPFDVMMSAPEGGAGMIRRLLRAGVNGLSINLESAQEMLGETRISDFLPMKAKFTRPWFEEAIVTAVSETGGDGRVRSLIIVGLEPVESTLEGIRWLAERGCDPVLSPFRPARRTQLSNRPPPSKDELAYVLQMARGIADQYGVCLGPRCIPCQHNTLTFPWDVVPEVGVQ